MIKELDVPLVWIVGRGWFNRFGGRLRPYDPKALRVDSNRPAEFLEEWVGVIRTSVMNRQATVGREPGDRRRRAGAARRIRPPSVQAGVTSLPWHLRGEPA